jgi:hypothetical protein
MRGGAVYLESLPPKTPILYTPGQREIAKILRALGQDLR